MNTIARTNTPWVSGLNLLDVQTKADQHDPDRHNGRSQPKSTIVALRHGFLSGLQVFGGDVQSGTDILLHQVLAEAMDRDSGLGKGISCLVLG